MVNLYVSIHLVGMKLIASLFILFNQTLMSVLLVSRHVMASLYVSTHLVGIAAIVSKVTIAVGQTIIMEVCVWVSIFLYSAYTTT